MINFIAGVITFLIFALPVVAVVAVIVLIVKKVKQKKEEKKRIEAEKAASIPKKRVETNNYWVYDTQDVEKFVKAYKNELEENSDYYLSKKELLEDFAEGDKVYKYEPFDLPLKMDGFDVYSYIEEDEWIKVGRLKKSSDLDGKKVLRLFVNDYKRIGYENVEKESGDSYFGVEVTKTIEE